MTFTTNFELIKKSLGNADLPSLKIHQTAINKLKFFLPSSKISSLAARPLKSKFLPIAGRSKLHALLSRLTSTTERLWRGTRDDKPVHFLHIGKTGGTAFKYAVATARRQNSRHGGFTLHLHPHSVKLRDIPNGDQFLFFIRDPVSKFVSGFVSRQRQGQPRHFVPWRPNEKEAFGRFSTPNQLALALNSQDSEEALHTSGTVTGNDSKVRSTSCPDWKTWSLLVSRSTFQRTLRFSSQNLGCRVVFCCLQTPF